MNEIRRRPNTVTPSRRSLVWIGAVLTVAFISIGCGPIERASVSITPIATVLEQPDLNNSVHIRGTVTNRVAILGNGLYEVEDNTGRLWVLTDNEVPALNSTVTVRGTSEGVMQLGGRHFGVTLKEDRRL